MFTVILIKRIVTSAALRPSLSDSNSSKVYKHSPYSSKYSSAVQKKLFQCPQCRKRYKTRQALKNHEYLGTHVPVNGFSSHMQGPPCYFVKSIPVRLLPVFYNQFEPHPRTPGYTYRRKAVPVLALRDKDSRQRATCTGTTPHTANAYSFHCLCSVWGLVQIKNLPFKVSAHQYNHGRPKIIYCGFFNYNTPFGTNMKNYLLTESGKKRTIN
ncbi:hypothetical protein JTE90_007922 [Oedothorax gibbosus]|uniref:C2H2-type domain-containing protein n=1 Tax=Oedothorax gibbosus TaxID=931172 RepID=A0AAV6VJW3_9ARAC|nr:hypothetical protein JTE90_007922 [Oedothorax gibbosus]